MSAKNFSSIRRKLLRWYDTNKRDLPWRRTADPYAIWVSETMLQQTQVKTVLPYYARFMESFPTLEALHRAPLPRVLRLWSGLGYYRRAENMKKAARDVIRRHGGKIPDRYDKLRALPGIGDYTAGAILSIAFHQPHPAIDGNVRRVYSRLFRITDEKRLRQVARAIVPGLFPGSFNQALMELGATICTPKAPRCDACPVALNCAYRSRKQPAKTFKHRRNSKVHDITWPLAIVRRRGRILLRRRAAGGFLAGLWELPGGQLLRSREVSELLRAHLRELPVCRSKAKKIGEIRHSITYRRIRAPLYLLDCAPLGRLSLPRSRWRWANPARLQDHAISSMTSKAVKILAAYEKSFR
jgi:A/G-specific adenine glycosylase